MSRLLFLCGDIGGTNSRLSLYATRAKSTPAGVITRADQVDRGDAAEEELIGSETYPSQTNPSLEHVVRIFLAKYNNSNQPIYCMVFAVAGPIKDDNTSKITNLSWVIDANALARTFRVEHVKLLNDFVGIGYGLLALQPGDLEVVHPGCGSVAPTGVKAVIGAGTGLGECFLTHGGREYSVWPAEGGHADFAPRNKTEYEIMEHIIRSENAKPDATSKIDRVSIERVTSGSGLPNIYDYFSRKYPGKANPAIAKEIAEKIAAKSDETGRVIAEAAKSSKCPICIETMDLFVQTYGAEAGNLCLKTLPSGGLFIAGGIAAKNMALMRKNNQFVKSYLAKGRMSEVLQQFPIYLITHGNVGLLGCQVICRRLIHEGKRPRIQSKL